VAGGDRLTRHGRAALVVLLVASAANASPERDERVPRSPEFVRRVGAAIDRGVAWLRSVRRPEGAYPDYPDHAGATTAFAYHAMRACGVPRDDVEAEAAWNALRRACRQGGLPTYEAVLCLMALSSHGDPIANAGAERDVRLSGDDAAWAAELASRLARGQDAEGRWSYGKDARGRTSDQDRGAAATPNGAKYDHSNTQYALLGLKCAARCGVAVPAATWSRSLAYFLAQQEKTGPAAARSDGAAKPEDRARGWGYMGQEDESPWRNPTPAMTAGGVAALVVCRSELLVARALPSKLDLESRQAVFDGLAWLGRTWSPSGPPRLGGAAPRAPSKAPPDLYEFYGVERAGVLSGAERIGGLDWYGDGAERLLASQDPNGFWDDSAAASSGDAVPERVAKRVVGTCFALLFLKKGTTPVRLGAVTSGGGDSDINFAEAAKATGKDLDDVLDLVLSRGRRATDDAVKTRLFDGATSIGPKIVEPLLVRMESSDVEKRASAHELLKRATGLDFGYVADAAPDVREAATQKWQAWWMASKDRLVYDAEAKRLLAR